MPLRQEGVAPLELALVLLEASDLAAQPAEFGAERPPPEFRGHFSSCRRRLQARFSVFVIVDPHFSHS